MSTKLNGLAPSHRSFVEQLRAVSHSAVIYVELHGAQHAFDLFGSPRSRRMVRATERFLFAVHHAYLHQPTSPLAPPDDPSARATERRTAPS